MMNGYPSIGQAMAQAGPAAGQCRCQQGCICRPGQPCRCSSGCTCSHASAAAQSSLRTRNWIESGENEMRRRSSRGAWLRTRARNMLQQRLARQDDWSRRSQLNGSFARRFNWGPQMGPVSRVIGSPYAQPDSRRFMFALARWQQRQGLPATGILSPTVWRRLLAILRAYPVGGPLVTGGWPQPQSSVPPLQEPGSGAAYGANGAYAASSAYGSSLAYGAGPGPDAAADTGAGPGAGPSMDAATDDAAMPLPGDPSDAGDAGGPEAGGNEFAPVGFRNRRNYAHAQQAMGQA